jgi:transporter family-2 protein
VKYLMIGLVALAGAGIPVQVAANHRLEEAVRSPALSVALAFTTGSLLMGALALSGVLGQARLAGIASAPWWVWTSGLLSVLIVLASILVLPRAGAGAVIAATVFGQLVAAVVLDHFGWLGVKQIPINAWRIAGMLFLMAGAALMQRK